MTTFWKILSGIAAAAMAFSSISVIGNSYFLKRFKIDEKNLSSQLNIKNPKKKYKSLEKVS